MNEERKQAFIERKEALKSLSAAAKMAMTMGATHCESVNEFVLDYYMKQNPEIKEFHTFNDWSEKGFHIKRGSKAFVIWGRPLKGNRNDPDEKNDASETDEDQYKFYPLCYLFADTQVEKREYIMAEDVQVNYTSEPDAWEIWLIDQCSDCRSIEKNCSACYMLSEGAWNEHCKFHGIYGQ